MRAQGRSHVRAHIWEHTGKSTHMREHTGEHTGEHTYESTEESTHMRAHIWEHVGAHIWGPKSGNQTWCEPEEAKSTGTSCQKSHFVWKFTGKNAHGHVRRAMPCVEIYRKKGTGTGHRSHFVASGDHKPFWMEVEAHVTRAILYGNLQEKCWTRILLDSILCGNLPGKNAHGHVRRAILCGNLQEKCRRRTFGAPTLCVNLQEKTRMDIAQGPFCVEIYRKNAALNPAWSPPGPTRAPFYSYRKLWQHMFEDNMSVYIRDSIWCLWIPQPCFPCRKSYETTLR